MFDSFGRVICYACGSRVKLNTFEASPGGRRFVVMDCANCGPTGKFWLTETEAERGTSLAASAVDNIAASQP